MIKQKNIFVRIAVLSILSFTYTIPILDLGLELVDYSLPTPNHKSAFPNPNIAFGDELADVTGQDLDNIQDLAGEFAMLEEDRSVTIASKMKEDISKAPSIVTVITAEQIEDMGFRTLTDILIIVPGIDVIKDALFGQFNIGGRGLRESEEKIKVLVDGHSMNAPYNGTAMAFFDDLSLKNVKRIEIVRGPGSALYGTNAFLAVINIVTKDVEDINGVEITSGFGSFDTQEYSILFGKNLGGVDVTGFADFYNTNGLSDTIKEDALSGIPFFNRFSITPDDTDASRNKINLDLKLSYRNIDFKAKYMNKDAEPFVGPNFVLTNDSDQHFNYVMGEIGYKFDIGEMLKVNARIYYDQYDIDLDFEAFPDGFTIPFDLDGDGKIERFPDGVLGQAIATNRILGSEIQSDYDLFDNNTLTLGFHYEWERQDNVTFHANFDPPTGASLGSVQNVSDTNWIKEVNRQIWAIYIQDKWEITDDLGLTIGVRHDQYSDFGGTTNPRLGLVWGFMENATLKLLYGQAFRAPNFVEQYTKNNPSFLGNPSLKPELIRTYELGLGYKFSEAFAINVNYFFNVIRDEIGFKLKTSSFEPQIWDNLGGSHIQGIEFEVKADLSDIWQWGAYAFANYTYLDAESKGDRLVDVPKHKGNVGVNAALGKHINANLHAFISGSRARAEADTRDDSPGFALMNLTLTAKDFFKGFKVKASLFNLFDKKHDDPTPINTIPTDIPRPGRTFYIELGYDW